MNDKPWFPYLTAGEKEQLEGHDESMKKLRNDAGIHARWRKQIIDRASKRMHQAESK